MRRSRNRFEYLLTNKPVPPHGFYRSDRVFIKEGVWAFRWYQDRSNRICGTIKAAPHSISNEGDAFSRFSGPPFKQKYHDPNRGVCDLPHHGA